jgi:hypothetical protein
MDASHLHFVAGRICDWLAFKHRVTLKHSHALDCVAAIPGLRNWPEVQAFPERVAQLTTEDFGKDGCDRLQERIKGRAGIDVKALEPLQFQDLGNLLTETWYQPMPRADLWPDGPQNGVYLTQSKDAAKAAIARFEVAYPDTIMYAEDPEFHGDGVVALGEDGIFSAGMERVPPGTLFVLGPLVLTEENWSDCRDRLRAAIDLPGRVVVLFDTPQPEYLFDDAMLLLQAEIEPFRFEEVLCRLRGTVTRDGKLTDQSPLGLGRRTPKALVLNPMRVLPQVLGKTLEAGIARRQRGFVILGGWEEKPSSFHLLETALPYTNYAGPAARILTDDRHGYDGDPPLSIAFAGLPVFPSVESAYRSGYRRMVIERPYAARESLLRYADDVCFLLSGGISWQASDMLLRALGHSMQDLPQIASKIVAALAMGEIEGAKGAFKVYDALPAFLTILPPDLGFAALEQVIEGQRSVRWEDQLKDLLETGSVTLQEAKKSLRGGDLDALTKLRRVKKQPTH